ncbi:MAG TPA: hypothetical protein VJT80_15295 [Steroidobacteraceae bacterium]|nr:hypothetical protein [Steroidobacteraceae bacterium]
MKRTLLAIAAVCTLGLLTTLVLGQEQRPQPPGVTADNWIPIGEKMGFVVTPGRPAADPSVLAGYFVAWHGDSWKRIDSAGPFQFQPLHK